MAEEPRGPQLAGVDRFGNVAHSVVGCFVGAAVSQVAYGEFTDGGIDADGRDYDSRRRGHRPGQVRVVGLDGGEALKQGLFPHRGRLVASRVAPGIHRNGVPGVEGNVGDRFRGERRHQPRGGLLLHLRRRSNNRRSRNHDHEVRQAENGRSPRSRSRRRPPPTCRVRWPTGPTRRSEPRGVVNGREAADSRNRLAFHLQERNRRGHQERVFPCAGPGINSSQPPKTQGCSNAVNGCPGPTCFEARSSRPE